MSSPIYSIIWHAKKIWRTNAPRNFRLFCGQLLWPLSKFWACIACFHAPQATHILSIKFENIVPRLTVYRSKHPSGTIFMTYCVEGPRLFTQHFQFQIGIFLDGFRLSWSWPSLGFLKPSTCFLILYIEGRSNEIMYNINVSNRYFRWFPYSVDNAWKDYIGCQARFASRHSSIQLHLEGTLNLFSCEPVRYSCGNKKFISQTVPKLEFANTIAPWQRKIQDIAIHCTLEKVCIQSD